ncbi:MAG: signal peptidase I [Lactimicrobium sp.]|uniref:signal peptidase I n=1 Tax=Lactimicrobium sp. TaxID=2563780 RepID=UPI002F35F3B2
MSEQNKKNTNETKDSQSSFASDLVGFLRDLLISVLVVLFIVKVIARPVQVIGSSMFPTLQNGELGFSNVVGTKLGHIKRFDVVIIYLEEKKEYLVKRVIGMPGETVSYQDGQLYINGEAVDEPFLDQAYVAQYGDSFMSDVAEITLGDDEYFCLGDNRPHSTDSRFYGPFKKSDIVAKGIWVFWPLNKMGVHTW